MSAAVGDPGGEASTPGPVSVAPPRRRKRFVKEPLACTLPTRRGAGLTPSRFNLDVRGGTAVYNTSTGNHVVLTADERRALDAALGGASVVAADAPRLYEAGLLIDPAVDEVAAIAQAFQLATGSRYAPHLTIAPTMDCNFGCAYCFESHTRGTMPDTVQDELVAFLDRLIETSGDDPGLTVTWFGGEPLLAMGAIERLTDLFRARVGAGHLATYSADVVTNGLGLAAPVIERLHRLDVQQVQVTIDGPAAVHDARRYLKASGAETFARIVANLHRAAERFRVVVRVNVDRTNADAVRDLFVELDAAGVLPGVLVDPARVEAFTAERRSTDLFTASEFAAWRAELQAWCERRGWPLAQASVGPKLTGVCQVDSINSFVVDPRGHLFTCWAELGTAAVPVGDVTDRSTWPDGQVGALAQRDPFDDTGCLQCLLLPMCLGSCPKTRQVGRDTGTSECPSFRHTITDLIEAQHGPETVIVRRVASA